MSTITGEIIKDFLHNHTILKKYDLFSDNKKLISTAFENLESTVLDKLVTIGVMEYTRGVKMSMNQFSLENVLNYFSGWIELNQLKLSVFDENERIRWICETKMGKNYNEICVNCFKIVLEKFGFHANVESFTNEDFEIIFLKKLN